MQTVLKCNFHIDIDIHYIITRTRILSLSLSLFSLSLSPSPPPNLEGNESAEGMSHQNHSAPASNGTILHNAEYVAAQSLKGIFLFLFRLGTLATPSQVDENNCTCERQNEKRIKKT